jgi:hypothetical protein
LGIISSSILIAWPALSVLLILISSVTLTCVYKL